MQVYTKRTSKVVILGPYGIRKPELNEVEFSDKNKLKGKVSFGTKFTDKGIIKCRCNKDEYILEMTKDGMIKISKGHMAKDKLQSTILQLAIQGEYKLELGTLENTRDTFALDKLIEHYKKST